MTVLIYVSAAVGVAVLARLRPVFPYLVVFILGLEYFSGTPPDSVFTIPKVGFAAIVLSQVATGRLPRLAMRQGLFVPLATLTGYLILSTIWSVAPARSATRAVSLLLLMILFAVVQGFVRSPKDLLAFWRAYVLYALASAALAFYQVLSGSTSYVEEAGARAGGLGVNPNEGGLYIGIGLLILSIHFSTNRLVGGWLRSRLTQVAVAGVLCLGLLATGSRGGIASVLAAAAVMVVLSRRDRLRAVLRFGVLVFGIASVISLFPRLPDMVLARFAEARTDQLGGRLTLWADLWRSVVAHPVFGSGLSTSEIYMGGSALSAERAPHNTLLGLLLDGGAVGLVLFGFVAWRIFRLVGQLRNQPRAGESTDGLILLVLLVLGAVFMQSSDLMFNKLFWCLLGLIEGAHRLQRSATGVVSAGSGPRWWPRTRIGAAS